MAAVLTLIALSCSQYCFDPLEETQLRCTSDYVTEQKQG